MNMTMTLHHQKNKIVNDKCTVKIGEDGRPYAKDGILIVADGLGGRGGFPHMEINRELLDRERFFDIAFKEGFEKADEDFKNFVLDSMSEFFETKDVYYTDPPLFGAMRTSGYFASRLVTAIVLYELKYGLKDDPIYLKSCSDYPIRDKDTLLRKLKELDNNEREIELRTICEKLSETIKTKLDNFVDRMGLSRVLSIRGSYLLPSTLVVALCDEHDNDVDVLYLWAGDSRGYLWDAKEGLAQVTDDHEKGETMTNLITLTREFTLEARFLTLEKPVVIFNASDGCYKCQCFASPIDLEYLLLQSFSAANSFKQASEILDKAFFQIGTHDDSNTIALASYGYDNYAAFIKDVEKRMDAIKKEYVDRLPDIFERDYVQEEIQKEKSKRDALNAIKNGLTESAEGKKFVVSFTKKKHNDIYEKLSFRSFIDENYFNKKTVESNESPEDIENKKRKSIEEIHKLVEVNWVFGDKLRKYSMVVDNKDGSDDIYAECSALEQIINSYKNKFDECVEKIDKCYNNAKKQCSEANKYINPNKKHDGIDEPSEVQEKNVEAIGDTQDNCSAEDEKATNLSNFRTQMGSYIRGFEERFDIIKNLIKPEKASKSKEASKSKVTINEDTIDKLLHDFAVAIMAWWREKYTINDEKAIDAMVDDILTKRMKFFKGKKINKTNRNKIGEYLNETEESDSKPQTPQDEDVAQEEDIAKDCVNELWKDESHVTEIVDALAESNPPVDRLTALSADVRQIDADLSEIKDHLEIREQLYEEYHEQYIRHFEESKLQK